MSIQRVVKQLGAALVAVVTVAMVTTPGHAVFTSKPPLSTLTASAAVGGIATVAITSVLIKNRSNDATVGTIGWTGATPGAGFLVADQYIQMVTNINTSDGGVQFYTDNTNGVAPAKFTGPVNATSPTPAGLVDNADGTQKLPTAWRASTFTLTGILPANPNITATGEGSLWFFHEDHAQVANNQGAANYTNGDPFITVYAAPNTPLASPDGTLHTTTAILSGLHFAQGPTQFGGFTPTATTDIYTEADFTTALAATTYSTTKLILEAFSL